jgi:hypothetical protein
VGNLKNVKLKKDLRPPFFGSFFGRAKNEQIEKESNMDLWRAKNEQKEKESNMDSG